VQWIIQPSLHYVFIAKFGSERNFKSGEHLAKLQPSQAKRLIVSCALSALLSLAQRCRYRQITYL